MTRITLWLVARCLVVGLLLLMGCQRSGTTPRAAGPIPDPTLAEVVSRLVGLPAVEVTATHLASIETLTVPPQAEPKVSALKGLEGCTTLRTLILQEQAVRDLAPLRSLSSLTGLNLEGNGIADIDPLGSCTGLVWLHLGRNEIADIAPLGEMTSLELLNLQNNAIASVVPLAGCSALADLNLRNNQLTSLEGLGQLKELKQVLLGGNPLTSLKPLIDNPGFTLNDRLVLDSTQAETLEKDVQALKTKGVMIVIIDNTAPAAP